MIHDKANRSKQMMTIRMAVIGGLVSAVAFLTYLFTSQPKLINKYIYANRRSDKRSNYGPARSGSKVVPSILVLVVDSKVKLLLNQVLVIKHQTLKRELS